MSSLKTTDGFCHDGRAGQIVKMGYLRKLKTMKKRFFILRGDSSDASARLEYYEDEKKWKKHHSPRRTISLKTCFNINRRQDTKHKHLIALYTKDDCFGLVLDSEEELEEWLKALLSLQYGEDIIDGEEPKPTFEHIWQVTVLKKGLGNSRNILGRYLLCLTDRSLSLVKMSSQEENVETYEFSLVSIRRCGHSDCFFYMEVGRSSCTGEGELWMQTEDTNIADNMHAAILHAMSNNSSKEDQILRPRSSSTNEVSKPIAMIPRRQTLTGNSTKEAAPPPVSAGSARIVPPAEMDSNQGSGRERSDSVPSRTRTVSDGPQALPHPHTSRSLVPSNSRPHSVCWPGGSPVSPASGPCSTDSPGSSLSIEEAEVECWGGYGHSLTPDEPAILEENCGEEVTWCANNSLGPPVRKISPSQLSANIKTGSPGQDTYSPYGSSPLDHMGSYMTMSPGTVVAESNLRRHATSSSNHSRASSLAEETPNGYVPMAPVDDGYVDMDPLPSGHKYGEEYGHGEMSPSSSCSITSGTPSTDMRFSEYHLEKVSSYFTPSEEDETSSLDRPTRAYSVGSRPETMKRTNRLELVNQADANRVRAFSVGSRTVNKLSSRALAYDLYSTRQHPILTPPHHHHLTPTPTPGNKKSLSAPLLCNSWSGGSTLRQHMHGSSQSSMEPMDDLMEMDFTRKPRAKPKVIRSGNKPDERERLTVPHSAITDGYVDMSTRSKQMAASPPSTADYHAQSQPIPTPTKLSVSPKALHSMVGPYVEMRPGSSPPTKYVTVQRKTSTVEAPFPEIKVLNNVPPMDNFIRPSGKPTSPIQEEYMDMGRLGHEADEGYGGASTVARTAPLDTPQPKKPPEGYVEMSWSSGSKPVHRSSLENYRPINERKDKRKGRYSSQPIAIQAGEIETAKPQSSSTSPVFSLSGLIARKNSVGTPPKIAPPAFLPLYHASSNSPGSSPSSSLRRKTKRRDSMENANAGLTTPTGSTATIFPFSLNSPGSPMKPLPGQQQNKPQAPQLQAAPGSDINYELSRKCPVDATSGTVRISYPQVPYSPTTPDSSSSSSEQPTPVNDPSKSHDYMNFSGDYAAMRPSAVVTMSRKISAPARVMTLKTDIPRKPPKLVTSSTAQPNKEAAQFTRQPKTWLPEDKYVSSHLPSPGVLSGSTKTEEILQQPLTTSMGFMKSEATMGSVKTGEICRQFSTSSIGNIKISEIPRQLSTSSVGSGKPGEITRQVSVSSVNSSKTGEITRQLSCSSVSTGKTREIMRQLSGSSVNSGKTEEITKLYSGSTGDSGKAKEITRQLSGSSVSSGKSGEITRQFSGSSVVSGKSREINWQFSGSCITSGKTGEIPRQLSGSCVTSGKTGEITHQLSGSSIGSGKTGEITRQLSGSSVGSGKTGEITRQLSCSSVSTGKTGEITRQLSGSCVSSGKAGEITRQLSGSSVSSGKTGDITRQLSGSSVSSGKTGEITRQLSGSSVSSGKAGEITRQLSGSSVGSEVSRQLSTSSISSIEGNSITANGSPNSSRPPSVSCERELHYASLDLAPSGSEGEDGSRSPRSFKTQGSLTESSTSSPSPNPVNQGDGESTFSYAEIDFSKSEGLRNVSCSLNKKLRH